MPYRTILFAIALSIGLTTDQPITIWLAGDSTMAEKLPANRPETGWGEMLGQYFRPNEVQVRNRALNGRSTKSFVSEGHWKAIADSLNEGDYVFIQFGHNDESKDKGDRYSTPSEFKQNLARMVTEVRAKKALPILFTPVERRRFNSAGQLEQTHGEYPALTITVAKELNVPLIDMRRASAEILASYGPDSSAKLFLQLEKGANPNYPEGVHDNTHFRPLGAELMARAAVQSVRDLGLELRSHLHRLP